jgi:hypothetical protein
MTAIGFLLYTIGLYLITGLALGLVFVIKGVRKLDPTADAAPLRVRMLFLPGCMAIWPLVLKRWMSGARTGAGHES